MHSMSFRAVAALLCAGLCLPLGAQPLPAADSDFGPPQSVPAIPAAPTVAVELNDRQLQVEVESLDNPLLVMVTTRGDVLLELFPQEAPQTVANFVGLAEGTKAFLDPYTGQQSLRPFYDGLIFHRVIAGFMIQGGSPTGSGDGTPGFVFADEINALSLGLDKMPVLDEDGYPNPVLGIQNPQDFQQRVLMPLYQSMGIASQAALEARVSEIDERLRGMTVKQSFELLGYRYNDTLLSRAPVRGVLAMANTGPDSNGSQFFITLADATWLTGKYTVFGKVRAGLEVIDAIGKVRVNADNRPMQEVTILSVRRINATASAPAPRFE